MGPLSQEFRMVRPPSAAESARVLFTDVVDLEREIRHAGISRGVTAHKSSSASGWTLPYGTGSFSRTAEASYQTSAPTDGSTPFLAWAATGVAVNENRGDGAGALLRIEGARTNRLKSSRDITNPTYWAGRVGVWTLTTGQVSPDGAAAAVRAQSGTWSDAQTPAGLANPNTLSTWARAGSTTSPTGPNYPGSTRSWSDTATTTYLRRSKTTPNTASAYYYSDTSLGGGAQDLIHDLHQVENGAFPSSAIRTTTTTVTRDADVLTFTSGQLDATFFTTKAKFLQVSPEFADTDLASADTYTLFSMNASSFVDGLFITHDGTGVCIVAYAGGAQRAKSGYLTFARNGLLGVVQWDPVTAVITVNGVSGSAGTAWSWTPATTRIGGDPGGTAEGFCRFGTLESA